MRKKLAGIFLCYLLLLNSVSITMVAASSESDDEVLKQQKVIQFFAEHDAPIELATTKDAKLTVYHIVDAVAHEHLPVVEMINDTKKCNLVYLVDVEIKGKETKYLYCLNESVISLISTYEFKNNVWTKVKK